ncbi:hypothetical protein DK926_18660 [Rhodococcus sp. Eu-32]|uniref:hypothetical protein n=1 Tax=Rhodococcus sp. Eu-32 TaxID=1017319 RepID=UPI000DF3AF5B|nr:hypothetical protein [Rhodococcus sp. Eu-32]RRQ26270.1 hypothetical protein DK926_18660 [Rhodococcus sp. Eu-32]
MIEERTLSELIADRKGTRSYERLSQDCGGTPTAKRLHQLATKQQRNFPDPPTIRGLALGLGVSVTDVVMAAARALGLSVGVGNDPHALTLPLAGDLPASARESIESVSRELVAMYTRSQASFEIAAIADRHFADTKDDHDDEEQEPRTEAGSTEQRGPGGGAEVRKPPMKLVKPTDGTDENQGDWPDGMPPFDPRKALAASRFPDSEASLYPEPPRPEDESQDPDDQ